MDWGAAVESPRKCKLALGLGLACAISWRRGFFLIPYSVCLHHDPFRWPPLQRGHLDGPYLYEMALARIDRHTRMFTFSQRPAIFDLLSRQWSEQMYRLYFVVVPREERLGQHKFSHKSWRGGVTHYMYSLTPCRLGFLWQLS